MPVMDDFVAHIDRAVTMSKRALNSVDRTNDACAKSPGLCQNHFHAETPVFCQPSIASASFSLKSVREWPDKLDLPTSITLTLRGNAIQGSKADVAPFMLTV